MGTRPVYEVANSVRRLSMDLADGSRGIFKPGDELPADVDSGSIPSALQNGWIRIARYELVDDQAEERSRVEAIERAVKEVDSKPWAAVDVNHMALGPKTKAMLQTNKLDSAGDVEKYRIRHGDFSELPGFGGNMALEIRFALEAVQSFTGVAPAPAKVESDKGDKSSKAKSK